jgi:YhcH/YjgK/YiaL family protein
MQYDFFRPLRRESDRSAKHAVRILPLLLLGCCLYVSSVAQSSSVSAAEAQQWVAQGAWRKGLTVTPHASVNAQTFYAQYHKHKDWWDKAMAFLNRKDLASLAPGTYPIVGKDVYASITEYVPKDMDNSQWESHKQYADIQAVITGKEKIGKTAVSGLTVTEAYDAKQDIAHYQGPGDYYTATPGTFFIFFPGEAHRPSLKTDPADTQQVKKLVIKMHVTD